MTKQEEELAFEWDRGNLDKSHRKHGVTPNEAEYVFVDKYSVVLPDEKHSAIEKRYAIFGKSNLNRYIYIIFTIRKGRIRIISARRMHRKELDKYENSTKSTNV